MDSILTEIKKLVNIDETDESFDIDVLFHINTAISKIKSLGSLPKNTIRVESDQQTWEQLIPLTDPNFDYVKEYIQIYTRLMFDPPASGTILQAFKDEIKHLEFLLYVEAEQAKTKN